MILRHASSPCRRFLRIRHHSSSTSRPLKIAIIGAGPSGFYAASRILSLLPISSPIGQNVQVHMYERLPTPYGLVRYGVAGDHPEVKNCQHKFDELAHDLRFSFFGNTSISSQPSSSSTETSPSTSLSTYTYPHALHIPLASLFPYYSTLLLTYGASLSNPLSSVPGSSSSSSPLQNVFPALAFVSWYNGHPAFSTLPVDLSAIRDVTVIGQGNVALDVCRILLKSRAELAATDMPEEVLETLDRSAVEHVVAVGRRGPAQVAFTTKEFREMLHIDQVGWGGVDARLMEEAKAAVGNERVRKRLLGLMATVPIEGKAKRFDLGFLRSPREFLPTDENKVERVVWDVNRLNEGGGAEKTGETGETRTDMVIESVGYRSEPIGLEESWTLPFDSKRGRVRNVEGRVVNEDDVAVHGIYAAGWAARGPVGVIASTMNDAFSLASLVIEDYASPNPSSLSSTPLNQNPEEGIPDLVQRGIKEGKVVTLDGWARIDRAERERVPTGSAKAREKFRTVEQMMGVLG
ncbi:ferredoxin/flavodoxin---NADP+ reductase, partial [Tremellales sp. Uapishka_1]